MAVPKEAARRFLIGLAAGFVILVIVYVAFTANQGRLPGTSPNVVRAEFGDVGQLQAGSEVRQDGLVVGKVLSVDLVDGRPLVTMDVNGGEPMYRDGYAGIWDQNTLAQKFVELRSGHPESGPLGGGVLPVTQTESTHDLVDLLDVFDSRTRAALRETLLQLGTGLVGRGPGLHEFVATLPTDLHDVGIISDTLVSDRTDLPGLLRSGNRLGQRFAGREQQWAELLRQTDETLQAISTDGGRPLGETLSKLPGAVRAVRAALDDARPPLRDLAVATGQLRSGAHSLGSATPDLRGVLRESLTPLNEVPAFADDAIPAVRDLTLTFDKAEPFAGKLAAGLSDLAVPLRVLAPYSKDIAVLFNNLGTTFAHNDGWEHRLNAHPTVSAVTGPLPNIRDVQNPYPAPGQAVRDRDRSGGLIPGN